MDTILLLTISNIFMAFAWYGHLKYTDSLVFRFLPPQRRVADMISAPAVVDYHDN
jgi:Putative member of DMT superfamily (DUF486)